MQTAGWRGRTVIDARRKCLRTLPIDYLHICKLLSPNYTLQKKFDTRPPLPYMVEVVQQPRPYQSEAITSWAKANHKGVVVLPTGAGKTLRSEEHTSELQSLAYLVCR